jgi:hypothetical protein
MDAEDWLYGDGEHEAAGGYRKKLSDLKAVGSPIAHRAAELAARPKVRLGRLGLTVRARRPASGPTCAGDRTLMLAL